MQIKYAQITQKKTAFYGMLHAEPQGPKFLEVPQRFPLFCVHILQQFRGSSGRSQERKKMLSKFGLSIYWIVW